MLKPIEKFEYLKPRRSVFEGNQTVSMVRIAITLLLSIIALINVAAFLFDVTDLPISHLVATVLSVYLIFEIRLLLQSGDVLGLLSPAFLSILLHFVTSYLFGITSATFEPSIMTRFGDWVPDLDRKLAGMLFFALISVFCMLRGYAIGRPLAQRLLARLQRTPSLRHSMRPNLHFVFGSQVIFLLIAGYSISTNTYGMLSTPEGLEKSQYFIQIIKLVLSAGSLGLLLIFIYYFQKRKMGYKSIINTFFILILFITHLFLGILSGFKFQVILPFLVITLAHFLVTQKIDFRFIVVIICTFNLAYAVIEPFRGYLAQQSNAPSSVSEALDAFGSSYQNRDQLINEDSDPLAQQISERFDLAGMTTVAIDFEQKGRLQEDDRTDFQNSILLAPVLAYVPRAVWADKPSYSNDGVWFNQIVLGKRFDELTSVGMGPIGYLYMTGGIIAIILGFAAFGVMQSLIFEGAARAGAGGLIVYLSLAGTLVLVPTAVGPSISGLLSLIPFAFIAQFFFLRKHDNKTTLTATFLVSGYKVFKGKVL